MVDLRQETQNVHDALWAHIDAGAFHRDIDKDSMCGLCAIASVALRDRLKRLGIEATLVLGYDTDTATVDPEDPDDEADCFHVWVLSEGQHLDPTYMQFGYDEPVWVGVRPPPRARATDWLRYHTVPAGWLAREPTPRHVHECHRGNLMPLGSGPTPRKTTMPDETLPRDLARVLISIGIKVLRSNTAVRTFGRKNGDPDTITLEVNVSQPVPVKDLAKLDEVKPGIAAHVVGRGDGYDGSVGKLKLTWTEDVGDWP